MCITRYAGVTEGRPMVRSECVSLRSEIEGSGDGVVSCWSGLLSGVASKALNGCWC